MGFTRLGAKKKKLNKSCGKFASYTTCVCVCVCERERERQRQRARERLREVKKKVRRGL